MTSLYCVLLVLCIFAYRCIGIQMLSGHWDPLVFQNSSLTFFPADGCCWENLAQRIDVSGSNQRGSTVGFQWTPADFGLEFYHVWLRVKWISCAKLFRFQVQNKWHSHIWDAKNLGCNDKMTRYCKEMKEMNSSYWWHTYHVWLPISILGWIFSENLASPLPNQPNPGAHWLIFPYFPYQNGNLLRVDTHLVGGLEDFCFFLYIYIYWE